jgi:rod shape determining protein RodA
MKAFKKVDLSLLVLPLILGVFGMATIFNMGPENSLFYKQLSIHTVGFLLAILLIKFDLRFLRTGHYTFIFYLISVALLLALVVLGATVNNAQSWFRIAGFSLQPVEIAKLALIFLLAKFFLKRHVEISYVPTLLISFLYAALIFALTLLQPDLGSALVVLFIWGVIVFVSGIPKKYILAIFGLATVVVGLSWQFLFQDYQKERIFSFLDPTRDIRGSGYNVYQSMIAIGSGGLWGKGISFGSQSKLAYLPEFETDFIFAAFAEEWGFIGTFISLFLYLILILKILRYGSIMESNFESVFAAGVAGYFIVHSGVNVGMNMGLLPVTGIPLPFMSAGGTHILVEWAMIGVLLSMSKFNSRPNTNQNYFLF